MDNAVNNAAYSGQKEHLGTQGSGKQQANSFWGEEIRTKLEPAIFRGGGGRGEARGGKYVYQNLI